jgi:ubiquitin-activating enzyme E1
MHRQLDHDIDFLQAVVLCGVSYEKQVEINDWTHQNGVHFISAETRGLFGYVTDVTPLYVVLIVISSVFNDFGPKFTCVDPTGEQALTGMIVSVEKVSLI